MKNVLNSAQQDSLQVQGKVLLFGPAGTGKSTALRHRLLHLLQQGEPAYTVLILVNQPEHEQIFLDTLHESGLGSYGDLKIHTYATLAREMVELFWPLVARSAGFARPFQPPTFLGYDLAQLMMWDLVTRRLAQGAFAELRLRPQQIVSQVLDSLNRAADNNLSLAEATQRLLATWRAEENNLRYLGDVEAMAQEFRHECHQNSLLDLSLVVDVFNRQVVNHPEFYTYFSERFRHMLVDNVEEQTPAGQQFVRKLMGATQSTIIVYDAGGGYRRFLSADPTLAQRFYHDCQKVIQFNDSFTAGPEMNQLGNWVESHLLNTNRPGEQAQQAITDLISRRYRREMLIELPQHLHQLLNAGVAPRDIAIVGPYLDGALRYNLTQALREAGIPFRILRRRSSPREEPRVRAWLTWLALAHPIWDIHPDPYDVTEALTLSLAGFDPARATLLVEQLYEQGIPALNEVGRLSERLVERIGDNEVRRYALLRQWLIDQGGQQPPDNFLYRLFNELLARPPFQPEPDLAGAAVCEWLVKTATRLHAAAKPMGLRNEADIGRALINGINQGLVTADPPELGDPPDPEGITIATVYAYLLAGEPVRYQVWLEAAAGGWWDIPRQPLSNAFVLAESYDPEQPWTMAEDFHIRNELLSRIVRGLAARCHDGIILATSDLDRRGQRQDSPLWRALQPILPE
ncbi:MAG: UvrD-helicase domain-containing protein [Candidatus Promineifilaceae bacterium]